VSAVRRAAGVATKATPAGRVVGAVAKHETAKRGADPRVSAPGSKAAQQRQAIEDMKARREPEPEPEDQADDEHEDQDHEHESSTRTGPSFGNPLAGMKAPATGGGFVLGLMAWAVVRAYIGNDKTGLSGPAGVKALLNAKLFNKVGGGK